MKTSTVNGVTYELPDGWEPIETVPLGIRLQVLYVNGESCPVTFDACFNPLMHSKSNRIAWQHIVAPKVMPWKPKYKEEYWCLSHIGKVIRDTWDDAEVDRDRHAMGNCYPTCAAAEAARERVVAAHTGGAKWKGGV